MKLNGLTLIVPIYNELRGIESTIRQMREIRKSVEFDLEIILVNDLSNDGTEKILNEFLQEDFVVINHPINRGYGAALKTGIKSAKFPYIAITDADGTYPNERIGEFYHETVNNDLDMTVGARVGKNASIPFIRKPAKWFLNKLANYLSSTNIPDLNSGFRIMKKEVLEKYLNILPDGFSFTTTITLAMLTNLHIVKYIPIDYFYRKGKSKIRPVYDTLNFIQLIIRTVLYFQPLRVFIPLSLLLVIIAFLVLILSWLFQEQAMDVTFGIIIMTAIMTMMIGMLADLIDKRIQK